MSDGVVPPPFLDKVEMFDDDDDSDGLFSSAIDDGSKIPKPNVNPLPELPTLQLSVDKGPPATPMDETVPDDVGLQSPPPIQKSQFSIAYDEQNGENSDQLIEISVKEGHYVGDGMSKYLLYKVNTRRNRKNSFSVDRRFSDFLGLHDKLVDKYLRAGRIIPPAPEKSVIGMTKIKMSGQNEQGTGVSEFIERRRAALERYLQRTASHPVLGSDQDFKDFLEKGTELPKATNTSALSGAGVMRLFNKVGETVNKITYKMNENDRWFDEKTQEIECLENGLRRLHTSVESLVLARKDLAAYTGTLAKSCAMLGSTEEHVRLSQCLVRLSELQEQIEGLHNKQANADFSILCELLKDYIALVGAIKEVFHERVKVYQNWQHAQLMLNKKREYKAKMELAKREDKVKTATKEIEECESTVTRCQDEFNLISDMIKEELKRFEVERVNYFKKFFIDYMEDQLKHQQQLMKYWEGFLPHAKAIA